MYSDIRRAAQTHKKLTGKIAGVVLNPSLWAIACYRLGHFLWCNDVILIPRLLALVGRIVSGIEIAPSAKIGPGLLIIHGSGVAIEGETCIGPRATIYQGVGIGHRFSSTAPDGLPIIGKGVTIYAGAKILGSVLLGDRCRVGANAVVTRSFSDDTTVAGVPARAIGKYTPPSTTTAEGSVVRVQPHRGRRPAAAGAFSSSAPSGTE